MSYYINLQKVKPVRRKSQTRLKFVYMDIDFRIVMTWLQKIDYCPWSI